MISYFLNAMGPVSTKWLEENGTDWTGGRIDIDGHSAPFGDEYGVPVMKKESWGLLNKWLSALETEELLPFKEIIDRFETEPLTKKDEVSGRGDRQEFG